MADQVTEEHERSHGPHPAARRCGTHRFGRTLPAVRTAPGDPQPRMVDPHFGHSIHRLVVVPGGRDYGQLVIQHRAEARRRRAKNRVAGRSRAKNRRRR